MLALILWWTFGWRFGVAEVIVELSVGVILGGGGGKRILSSLRALWPRRPRLALDWS